MNLIPEHLLFAKEGIRAMQGSKSQWMQAGPENTPRFQGIPFEIALSCLLKKQYSP
jgi:hypothetical protein